MYTETIGGGAGPAHDDRSAGHASPSEEEGYPTMSTASATDTWARARPGDGLVVHEHHRTPVLGMGLVEYDTFEVGTVTATLEGWVTWWRPVWVDRGDSYSIAISPECTRVWIVPAAEFAIEDLVAAVRDRTWPTGGLAQPFESLAEVRAALAPWRVRPGHGTAHWRRPRRRARRPRGPGHPRPVCHAQRRAPR